MKKMEVPESDDEEGNLSNSVPGVFILRERQTAIAEEKI